MTNYERKLHAAQRRAKVARLVLEGVTNQRDIAVRVGLGTGGHGTISRDLAIIREQWRESGIRDLDEAKGRMLDQLELALQELWAAWERSKQPRESSRSRRRTTTGDRSGQADEAEARKEPRDGNPRFMELILKNLAQQASILGLNAPTKVRHGQDEEAGPVQVRMDTSLSLEEFRRLPVEEKVRHLQARFIEPSQN